MLQHLLFWQNNYLKQKKNQKNRYSKISILKDEIEKMSKEEIETEKPDKILKIVEEILNFNKKIKKNQEDKAWKY